MSADIERPESSGTCSVTGLAAHSPAERYTTSTIPASCRGRQGPFVSPRPPSTTNRRSEVTVRWG